ncbi:protein 5NUC-like isoform X4 [Leptidea sinapis]|uniref:protein 5NUC-like isoform X4 n=1 Tax=Leptidea sinapis TaxID=189913 RepID=UPI0021C2CC1D|nr:protein 5NUC-like isoform X4 [Leptidea sinapis]
MARLPQLTTVIAVALSLSSCSIVSSPGSDGTFELLIIHNNDMHARFEQTSQLSGACTTADRDAGKCYGGFPRVATVVKEARKAAASGQGPPVLYLNAGDTYTGTAWFTIYKWKIAAEFLNALEPDAVSLGNHEFDHGVSGLTPFIENLTSPVLAANLVLTKVPELEDQTNLRKSIVFNISETHIGVIGYLTPETKTLAVQNDVEYIDEIVALKKEVKRLKKEGVNIIIALGHSGYLKDLQIAKEVEGLNLVIGGHTNTFLWNGTSPDSEKIIGPYPTYVTQPSGKQVPVVQAYAYTKYLGKLHMVFNTNGDLIKADGNPVLLDNSIPQDPEVLSIIDKYREKVLNFTEEIIGNTTVVLDGLVTCQHKECNLGNLIADAMVYKYSSEYTGKEWTDAPIAIIQGGGIRSSISMAQKSAIVTKGDLITALPFEGVLVVVTMNGSILMQMLEHSVANLNDIYYPGEFLQVSGLKIVYDLKKPDNHKVVKAVARCWNCTVPKYTDVDVRESYNVIMPYFVANGGDGYWMLKGLPTRVLDYNELSSTITYFRKYSPVHPEIEGRITFLQKNKLCSLSNNLVSSTLLISVLIACNYIINL